VSQKEVSQAEIDWAYEVLTALKEGLDRVAAEPRLKGRFVVEVVEYLPDILDAFVCLVKEEHRGLVLDVIGAATKAFRRME